MTVEASEKSHHPPTGGTESGLQLIGRSTDDSKTANLSSSRGEVDVSSPAYAFPRILNIVVPQVGHFAFAARRPFFVFTSW